MSEKAENFTLTTTRELAAWMRRNHFFAVTAHEDPDGKSHEHMAWMLDRVNLDDMNLSKANRWIGYVQAYLVINKLCSLEDVKKDTHYYRDRRNEGSPYAAPGLVQGADGRWY